MNSPVSAISYLGRAKALCSADDKASLIYAALELRCGVEARLQEHASVAVGVSKRHATQYEIKKLGRTVDSSFGLGDSFLIIHLAMADGRACNFVYAPVSVRLQDIATRCGNYLHAMRPEQLTAPAFWDELRAMLDEGCALLELACSSEVLRPSFEQGLHFTLPPGDPRIAVISELQAGAQGSFSATKFTPSARLTFYPPDHSPE